MFRDFGCSMRSGEVDIQGSFSPNDERQIEPFFIVSWSNWASSPNLESGMDYVLIWICSFSALV